MVDSFWNVQIQHAHELDSEELERHALVSINNRHECRECFCCACLHVLNWRERSRKRNPHWDLTPATNRIWRQIKRDERREIE